MKTKTITAPTTCHKCGSKIDSRGLCNDITCPYSEWTQNVKLCDLQNLVREDVIAKYGKICHIPDGPYELDWEDA